MKLGTEDKKKTYAAIGLTAVALLTVYVQFFSGSQVVPGAPPARSAAQGAIPAPVQPQARSVRRAPPPAPTRRRSSAGGDFEPIWRRSHEDDEFNPVEADPTLRTELLAAVRESEFSGVERNIFQFTTRPVKQAPPSPDLVKQAQERQRAFEEAQAAAKPAETPQPVPKRAPRITWKYYGFASEAGETRRRAFLLDGEDVMIAAEGDLLKGGRYKIVRIGLSNIVIEDTEFSEQQTLSITVEGT